MFRHISHIDDELISVRGIYRDGQAHRSAGLIKRGPEYLKHAYPAIWGQAKKAASVISGVRTNIQSRYPTCLSPSVSARYCTVPTPMSPASRSLSAPLSTNPMG